jgi:ABC-type transport system involved in cytochrome c biogenesis permease subunit
VAQSRAQKTPEMFRHYVEKLDTEVFYNDARPFFFASLLSLLIGLVFLLDITRKKLNRTSGVALYLLAMTPLVLGIGLRVYITQFAPVTNMFSTMLWVAFGVLLFSLLLFYLYENYVVCGLLMTGTGLLLMLTEQIPLILSPDLDPLVAVLRSNFWLSTHVTTITISYAAYTIAMILGNAALVKVWMPGDHSAFIREYSHYAYRMIQLGCFLLSIGIILGGVWADYSWGRFWGWDPKETWALIADMGFLVLLHARFVGWVSPFLLLALSPVAYLLVIMAWYGVNFILAAGLHSYGFSSGGTMAVVIFVSVQTLFIALSTARMLLKKSATR